MDGEIYSKLAVFVDIGLKNLNEYNWFTMRIEKTFHWESEPETTLILRSKQSLILLKKNELI